MSLQIRWLGQAGFIITSPSGIRVAIDPYLGNSCLGLVGYKRMTPAPISIKDFSADILLISHEHPDHLDIDLLRALETRTDITIYGNDACRKVLLDNHLTADLIQKIGIGSEIVFGDIRIRAVASDHGGACVEPLGFLIDAGETCIYFAGDTAFTPDMLTEAVAAKPDIALLPINGMYGNLNSDEAVALASDLRCKTVIPCHYWMFVEHGSDPLSFFLSMESRLPNVSAVHLSPGEVWTRENT